MPVDFYFKPKCCLPKPLKKNIYNPEVLSKFPLNIRIAHQIVTSVGTPNQCYTRISVPLNAYGRWAGAPGGSGPGVSSTMNYVPYTDTSGLGPTIGGAICNCGSIGPFPTYSPINTIPPVVYGNTIIGSTLTTTNGTWLGNPSPTFTYQWFRGNTPIPNQTNITYVIVLADGGLPITCRVTATNSVGSANATSNVVTPILGNPQTITFTGNVNFETIYVNSLNQVVVPNPVLNGFTIYRVTATSSGANYLINSSSASTPVSFLIVGGGGSGAGTGTIEAGAGGAGGFIESSGTTNSNTAYSVYVGKGGFLLNNTASGENSLLQLTSGTLTAVGGGGGGNLSMNLNGLNGGSGGGGAFNYNNNMFGSGGNGTPGQGFSGAAGNIGGPLAGSGGGAGGDGIINSLNGGPGLPSTITGQNIYYAGGGGGVFRTGGIGGGGNGRMPGDCREPLEQMD